MLGPSSLISIQESRVDAQASIDHELVIRMSGQM